MLKRILISIICLMLVSNALELSLNAEYTSTDGTIDYVITATNDGQPTNSAGSLLIYKEKQSILKIDNILFNGNYEGQFKVEQTGEYLLIYNDKTSKNISTTSVNVGTITNDEQLIVNDTIVEEKESSLIREPLLIAPVIIIVIILGYMTLKLSKKKKKK